ncbi:MAG: DCC1-like thiol-disulfide oxidoreductase family protein [Tepidisphaeraceae bacterium]
MSHLSPTTLRRRFDDFWFATAGATDLGFSRLLFFALVLAFHLRLDVSALADAPGQMWWPTGMFKHLHLGVAGYDTLAILQAVWKVSLVLACIGLFTRASVLTAAILGAYLLGLPHNFGKANHSDAVLIFSMLILACSRCGDAWSLDQLLRWARERGPLDGLRLDASGEYRWPIRMIWVVGCLVFFAAGFAKLYHSGLHWGTAGRLSGLLLSHQYSHRPLSTLGLHLADHLWLEHVIGAGTLICETLLPLALFSRRARMLLVPAAFFMQLGIGLFMGVWFTQFFAIYIFWLPWAALLSRIRRALTTRAPRQRLAVLYDGSCGLCQSVIRLLRFQDPLRRLKRFDVRTDWAKLSARFPHLDRERCMIDMYVVAPDGSTAYGFDGYRQIARRVPAWWPIVPLLYLPGVAWVGRRVYRRIADRRFDAGCALPTTAPPAPPPVSPIEHVHPNADRVPPVLPPAR